MIKSSYKSINHENLSTSKSETYLHFYHHLLCKSFRARGTPEVADTTNLIGYHFKKLAHCTLYTTQDCATYTIDCLSQQGNGHLN